MFEFAGLGVAFLTSILISGFFLWIGLRVIGKKRGILEAGLANFAASIFAAVIFGISATIPFFGIFSPFVGFLAYLYALKTLLKVSLIDALAVSVIALMAFIVAVFLFAMIGFQLFSLAPQPYSHIPGGFPRNIYF